MPVSNLFLEKLGVSRKDFKNQCGNQQSSLARKLSRFEKFSCHVACTRTCCGCVELTDLSERNAFQSVAFALSRGFRGVVYYGVDIYVIDALKGLGFKDKGQWEGTTGNTIHLLLLTV